MQLEQPLAGYNGKPEIDDGHTKIANELLDAILAGDFSKRQLLILLFIIRKTYGWNKSEDDISRSQMSDATKLKNSHITTTIQELLERNVIIVSSGTYAKRYKINKYYDTWRVTETVIITKTVPVTKTVTITETVIDCYQNGNSSLPNQYPQKTTPKDNTKDNIATKKKSSSKTLKDYIEDCKEKNIRALPEDCIVFKNAKTLKIDDLWLRACWHEFKQKYFENGKKQTNWISTFNNCVKGNWYKIWAFNRDGELFLTTEGNALVKIYEESLKND